MEVVQLLRSQGPCNAGRAGVLVAIFTGNMVLLGFFLFSGSSAPVRIEHGGGAAAWIVIILAAASNQGCWWPQTQKLWHY